jgi:hypothetical protein
MAFGSFLSSFANNVNSAISSANNALSQAKLNNLNAALSGGARQLTNNDFGRFNENIQGALSGANGISSSANAIQNQVTRKLENLSQAGALDFEKGLIGKLPQIRDFEQSYSAITVVPETLNGTVSAIDNIKGAVTSGSGTGTYDDAILRQARQLDFGGAGGREDRRYSSVTVDSAGRLLNPLRSYATYNYRLTLGCVSDADLAAPESSFRSNGLTNVICQTGGGQLQNRVTTFSENNYGLTTEYFLEDLEVEALISPNSQTGTSTGTKIAFTIIEPYSMGQLLEALQIAAAQANYTNYIEAPYVLKIEFLGFDEDSKFLPLDTSQNITPKYIPLKLTNIEFQVDGQGSRYSVEAIPYNEQALADEVAQVPVDVSIGGNAVGEYLQSSERSLTNILNARKETREDTGVAPSDDRYIVMFPIDKQGATRVVEGARVNNNAATQNPFEINRTLTNNSLPGAADGTVNGSTQPPTNTIFDLLKAYAETDINEIGRSILTENSNDGGTRQMGQIDATIYQDGPLRHVQRNQVDTADLIRIGQYTQGTNITGIIEDVVLNSEYGRTLAELPAENGLKKWFKIETQVFVNSDLNTELKTGKKPKIYVYSVVPFWADEAKFLGPGRIPSNTQQLKDSAVKEYNYFYTGKNEDVLDFQIEFKGAFYQNLYADLMQGNSSSRTGSSAETVNGGTPPGTEVSGAGVGAASNGELSEQKAPTRDGWQRSLVPNGLGVTASQGTKRAIAEAFHNTLINGDTDMVQAEMEIWGDPFWLPTSGMGNYNAPPSGSKRNLNADGTVDYQNEEVLIVVNFRTPLDYVTGGQMQFSKIVKPFSGLFQVTQVTNTFSRGQFKCTLSLLRRRGQNDEETGDTEVIAEGNGQRQDWRGETREGPASGGEVGQPNNSGVTSSGPDDGNRTLRNDNPPGIGGGTSGGSSGSSTAPQGSPNPGTGNLATITTSIRGLTTQVAAVLAPNFQGLIDELEGTYGYEITSLGGYNYRTIANSSTLSWHAGGVAIDINPARNPFITRRGAAVVTDMPLNGTGSAMTALAAKYGLGWGGDWSSSKDAMHFSAARNEGGTLNVRRGEIPT